MADTVLPNRYSYASRRRPGTQPRGPVRVDWSNALARGLVGGWLTNGNNREVVTQRPLPITGTDFRIASDTFGSRVSFNALQNSSWFEVSRADSEPYLLGTRDFSWLGIVYVRAAPGEQTLFQIGRGQAGGRRFSIFLNTNETLDGEIDDDGAREDFNFNTPLTPGARSIIVVTADRDGLATGYVNGVQVGTATISGAQGSLDDPDHGVHIGYNQELNVGSRDNISSSAFELNLLWRDRILTPAQVLSISRDPYQVLRPAVRTRSFAPPLQIEVPAGGYRFVGRVPTVTIVDTAVMVTVPAGGYRFVGRVPTVTVAAAAITIPVPAGGYRFVGRTPTVVISSPPTETPDMSISYNRYINITSGLGAGAASPTRDFIGRLITTNSNLPTNGVEEFTSLDAVGNYFGVNTDEYRRAQFYFGFVSKAITRPSRISFARWAEVDTAPIIIGTSNAATLAQLQAVSAGDLTVTLGTITEAISPIDLSSATSFTDVASTLQTAVRAANVDPLFASAIVTYSSVFNSFLLAGGATGPAAISVTGTGNLVTLLGFSTGARLSPGVAAQTVTEVLAASTATSNNFGSFAFVPTLTTQQVTDAATWNDGNNLLFMFMTPVTPTDAASVSAAVIGLGGTGLTLNLPTLTNEFPEMLPMAVFAATDYTRRASVQNYMFQQASLTATVTSDTDADLYDGLRINYYGQTQSAGQFIEFYQRGFLTGAGTDPVNMNVFANEIWLKDFAGAELMTLLLANRLPANEAGRGAALVVLRDVAAQGLVNGTISVGGTLTSQQRIFITEQTNDPTAFQQVQTSGFWLDASVQSEVVNNVTEFFLQYTLLYRKDDVIRRVDGRHTLI